MRHILPFIFSNDSREHLQNITQSLKFMCHFEWHQNMYILYINCDSVRLTFLPNPFSRTVNFDQLILMRTS